jgi:hypothetical protein
MCTLYGTAIFKYREEEQLNHKDEYEMMEL